MKTFAAFTIVATVVIAVASAHTIKHVVVLMEENRSFDHLFGWAGDVLGINGLTGKEFNPLSSFNASSEKIYVTKNAPFVAECDPQHLMFLTTPKIFGVKNWVEGNITPATAQMSGFIEVEHDIFSKDNCRVLDMFPPEHLPVFTGLAKEYAIMDRFFCSVPGPTWPNRQFAMAATSGGSTETFNWFRGAAGNLFPQKTFFDQVAEAGKTWRNYYVDTPWELFMQSLANHPENLQQFEEFRKDAASGNLPTYSFINPRASVNVSTGEGSTDMHPDHDVRLAEAFVHDVYETLRASPAWNDTLLIVTFDEHGGFYDHVVPPMNGIPAPDNFTSQPDPNFKWDRLGIRIPTLLISPWIKKGTVISAPPEAQKPTPTSEYDLTSIMATVRKIIPELSTTPPLTHRDAWAATFEHAVESLTSPRADCPLSIVPAASKMLKTRLTQAEAIEEASRPVNGLQDTIVRTFGRLHGMATTEIDSLLKAHQSQGQVVNLISHLHSTHLTRAHERRLLREEFAVWTTPLMEWYWLLNIGESFWNVTHASNATLSGEHTVTISTRTLKTPSGQPYCLDRRPTGVVGVSPCNAGTDPSYNNDPSQQWTWGSDASVRGLGADSNLCITTNIWKGIKNTTVTTCDGGVNQHFAYQGSAPGNGGDGRIMFGNGIYNMGVVPMAKISELEALLKSKKH